jgi:hypothetical protein
MANLQERAIAAHGGLPKWERLSTMRAHLTQGGVLWALKGQEGTIDDVDLHRQFSSHSPIGGLGNHSVFRGDYIAIEDGKFRPGASAPGPQWANHPLWTTFGGIAGSASGSNCITTYTAPLLKNSIVDSHAHPLTPQHKKHRQPPLACSYSNLARRPCGRFDGADCPQLPSRADAPAGDFRAERLRLALLTSAMRVRRVIGGGGDGLSNDGPVIHHRRAI